MNPFSYSCATPITDLRIQLWHFRLTDVRKFSATDYGESGIEIFPKRPHVEGKTDLLMNSALACEPKLIRNLHCVYLHWEQMRENKAGKQKQSF